MSVAYTSNVFMILISLRSVSYSLFLLSLPMFYTCLSIKMRLEPQIKDRLSITATVDSVRAELVRAFNSWHSLSLEIRLLSNNAPMK